MQRTLPIFAFLLGTFSFCALAETGPIALPRARTLLKGAFGEKTSLSATALDDLSTGGTDGAGTEIAISAKYLKLLTRNGFVLEDGGWQSSVELDPCEYTAKLKVVNANADEAESSAFRISVAPFFFDATTDTAGKMTASTGSWRIGTGGVFDNKLPTGLAQSTAALAYISGNPSQTYKFTSTSPVLAGYSIRPVGTIFVSAGTARNRAPKAWTFSGSTDGSTWVELDSRSNQTGWDPTADGGNGEIRYYGCNGASVGYAHYRIQFTADNGDAEVGISEVEFYTEPNEDLFIRGTPSNYSSPTPAYGLTSGHAIGDSLDFSIASCLSAHAEDGVRSVVLATGKRIRSLGYTLENGDGVTSVASETRTGYYYVGATRFTWNWQIQYRLGASVADAATGSITLDDGAAASSAFVWKDEGQTTTLRAVPAEGYKFSAWSGNLAESQKTSAEITLTHSQARSVTAAFVTSVHVATNVSWTGNGTGTGYGGQIKAWDDPANWDLNTVPGTGDTVRVACSSTTYITLTAPTPELKKLTLGGALNELRVSGWNSKIEAETVEVASGVTVCPLGGSNAGASDTNRVWIVCRDFTLASGAAINADQKGFRLSGPGTTLNTGNGSDGASHGGRGGAGKTVRLSYCGPSLVGTACELATPGTVSARENDSLTAPVLPGSGGYIPEGTGVSVYGGGAVRIEATGRVTINGVISADGSRVYETGRGGSAGGSVYVTCATVDGSGTVRARGGALNLGSDYAGAGGGGRVSIVWSDAAAQRLLSPTLNFDLGGCRGYSRSERRARPGEPGTLYLSDSNFYPRATCTGGGRLHFPTPKDFVFDDLTIRSSALEFADGSTLAVRGNLTLADGGELASSVPLTIGGDVVVDGKVSGSSAVVSALTLGEGAGLTVGGSLTLANGGELCTQGGVTNAPDAWGCEVKVGGAFTVASGGRYFPQSHPTNAAAGATRIIAESVVIAEGGLVEGLGAGWQIRDPRDLGKTVRGYGPGASAFLPGASHAGCGGQGGAACYGWYRLPLTPGSGGAGNGSTAWQGTPGGGQIAFFVRRDMTVDGTIRMSGASNAAGTCAGAGSGGSVYIEAKRLMGSGSIAAAGGSPGYYSSSDQTYKPNSQSSNYGKGGGGGGGYVMVRASAGRFTGTVNVSGGSGYYDADTGEDHRGAEGRYKILRPSGGMIIVR